MRSYRRKEERPWQEGVTGLETAVCRIVLILPGLSVHVRVGVQTLFITPGSPWENGYVSSVFAFAALSTGLFSADPSQPVSQWYDQGLFTSQRRRFKRGWERHRVRWK